MTDRWCGFATAMRCHSGQCCPLCGQIFLGSSLKQHLQCCARQSLAQLDTCQHCCRPIHREDLAEHTKRCKGLVGSGQAGDLDTVDEKRRIRQTRNSLLRESLARLEAGSLLTSSGFDLDGQGSFQCNTCKECSIGLADVLEHEKVCSGAADPQQQRQQQQQQQDAGDLPRQQRAGESADGEFRARMSALVNDMCQQLAAAEDVHGSSNQLQACLDSLQEVVRNACYQVKKKYRRLRISNSVFHEAIGRWPAAVSVLEAVGFERAMHSSKGAEPEAHLLLQAPMPESKAHILLDVLGGSSSPGEKACATAKPLPEPAFEKTSGMNALFEECLHCQKRFRFDRIAKHETRCRAAKPRMKRFDAVFNVLGGTVAEHHIASVRASLQEGVKLPPLQAGRLSRCARCGEQMTAEALSEHVASCKVSTAEPRLRRNKPQPLTQAPRPHSSGTRPPSASSKKRTPSAAVRGAHGKDAESTSLTDAAAVPPSNEQQEVLRGRTSNTHTESRAEQRQSSRGAKMQQASGYSLDAALTATAAASPRCARESSRGRPSSGRSDGRAEQRPSSQGAKMQQASGHSLDAAFTATAAASPRCARESSRGRPSSSRSDGRAEQRQSSQGARLLQAQLPPPSNRRPPVAIVSGSRETGQSERAAPCGTNPTGTGDRAAQQQPTASPAEPVRSVPLLPRLHSASSLVADGAETFGTPKGTKPGTPKARRPVVVGHCKVEAAEMKLGSGRHLEALPVAVVGRVVCHRYEDLELDVTGWLDSGL